MPEYVYSIIFIVIIFVIVILWTKKKKDEEWEGELVKKRVNWGDEESAPIFYLIFKSDSGKRKKVTISSEREWNEWEVGDRGKKDKGEFFPKRM